MALTPFQALVLDALAQSVFGAYSADRGLTADPILPWFDMSPPQRGHWRLGASVVLTAILDRGERRPAVLGRVLFDGCAQAANGRDRQGAALGSWDDLSDRVRGNWIAGAGYVSEAWPP